jgi:CheY-like chemotaxis protein/sensor domain CHASE-containing protein
MSSKVASLFSRLQTRCVTPRHAALGCWGIGILISLGLYTCFCRLETHHAQQAVDLEARRACEKLTVQLEDRVYALRRMAHRWESARPPPNEAIWHEDAALYVKDMPGFQSIGYLDPEGGVRFLAPLAGNQQLLGLNFMTHERLMRRPFRRRALEASKRTHLPTVTQMVDLAQGGRGFLMFAPIFFGSADGGTIFSQFRFDAALQAILGPDFLSGFAVQVRDVSDLRFFKQPVGSTLAEGVGADFRLDLPQARFEVHIAPTLQTLQRLASHEAEVVLLVSLGVSLIASIAVFLAVLARQQTNQLRDAEMAARQSTEEAAQARSRFYVQMSHRMRTPLNGVLGMSQLLQDTRLDAEQQRYLSIVRASGQTLLQIVDEVLGAAVVDVDVDVDQGVSAVPAAPAVPSARRSRHVLVVDDNAVNQLLTISLLKKLGFSATAAANGQEALEVLEAQSIDLVLMDCQMPVMDGYEATRLLRERERGSGRHLPVIALTAQALAGDERLCLQAGMDHYLTKPLSREQLKRALQLYWC